MRFTRPDSAAAGSGSINRIVFSPDGSQVASAGPGRLAYLWDVASGVIQRRLSGAFFSVADVDFSPDGATLMVGSVEGTSRGYALDAANLLAIAESRATRELTNDECLRYLGQTCAGNSSAR